MADTSRNASELDSIYRVKGGIEMLKTIIASESMVLTNGTAYGTTIFLADGVDASSFYEITLEEYEAMFEGEEATEEDYISALGEMGVEAS